MTAQLQLFMILGAVVLLLIIVGGLYDFIVATFGWWNEMFTTRVIGLGETLADKAKLVFKVNTGAAVFGLGYIIGLKYAFIITLGSLAVWWVLVPGMGVIFHDQVLNAWNPELTTAVGAMSPEEIFKYYGKSIGIGGIAMAGIIGIIKSWGIIKSAVSLAAREMKGKGDTTADVPRTQRDISFYRHHPHHIPLLLVRRDGGQPSLRHRRHPARGIDSIPVHHRGSQRHRHCG